MAPPTENETLDFGGPSVHAQVDGLLFDMDGTLIDSTPAIVKHWHRLGKELGVDPEVILHSSHGRRSVDTLALYNKDLATWDYVFEIEGRIPREYGNDATEIAGARALLDSLQRAGAPWMIVTSGTRPLLTGWLDVMQLAHPPTTVVAEDVSAGKPDPSCYLLGRERLGLGQSTDVLVLEDAPAGVRAGKAAGFKVVALATTHVVSRLVEAGADWVVKDLTSVTLQAWDPALNKASICISNTLVA